MCPLLRSKYFSTKRPLRYIYLEHTLNTFLSLMHCFTKQFVYSSQALLIFFTVFCIQIQLHQLLCSSQWKLSEMGMYLVNGLFLIVKTRTTMNNCRRFLYIRNDEDIKKYIFVYPSIDIVWDKTITILSKAPYLQH